MEALKPSAQMGAMVDGGVSGATSQHGVKTYFLKEEK